MFEDEAAAGFRFQGKRQQKMQAVKDLLARALAGCDDDGVKAAIRLAVSRADEAMKRAGRKAGVQQQTLEAIREKSKKRQSDWWAAIKSGLAKPQPPEDEARNDG